MSDKFNQWIKDSYFKEFTPEKDRLSDMEKGWDGCKQEMLNFISEFKSKNGDILDSMNPVGLMEKIKEEINNL